MSININFPDHTTPRIAVIGVGGAGGNAVDNMIDKRLEGVDFYAANTDAQALSRVKATNVLHLGREITKGLGAGSNPNTGSLAAEESIEEISNMLDGYNMIFITAGMGGGTGTGAAPIIAQAARQKGILTVAVVSKPFAFEGKKRMGVAEAGIEMLENHVDTILVIPNQNLFALATERTTLSQAFAMADEVLNSGVAGITNLMIRDGLINLDFADVNAIMAGNGRAMMGQGVASGEGRAREATLAAIANPLLDGVSIAGAKGVLLSITGGSDDLTLFEIEEAASTIKEQVDEDANIIFGAIFDDSLEGALSVSIVATGVCAKSNGDKSNYTSVSKKVQIHQNVQTDQKPAFTAQTELQADLHTEAKSEAKSESSDPEEDASNFQESAFQESSFQESAMFTHSFMNDKQEEVKEGYATTHKVTEDSHVPPLKEGIRVRRLSPGELKTAPSSKTETDQRDRRYETSHISVDEKADTAANNTVSNAETSQLSPVKEMRSKIINFFTDSQDDSKETQSPAESSDNASKDNASKDNEGNSRGETETRYYDNNQEHLSSQLENPTNQQDESSKKSYLGRQQDYSYNRQTELEIPAFLRGRNKK